MAGCSAIESNSQNTLTTDLHQFTTTTQTNGLAEVKGASFVSTSEIASTYQFEMMKQHSGGNWVSLMPFGFCEKNGKEVKYNAKFQWKGETSDGISQYIDSAKAEGLKVMLKPQIWMMSSFTGDFMLETDSDWKQFETSYKEFILEFAVIANTKNVELFCIGTEFKQFVLHRPKFWFDLINDVKQVYKGQLTYAANWDCYDKIPFWKELDYVGIDAYFPISDDRNARKEDFIQRFNELSIELSGFLKKNGLKQLLFTEYGWRSSREFLNDPWNSDRSSEIDLKVQEELYEAFFQTIWKQDWFKGGFVWKWFPNHQDVGGKQNSRFTPQNKPAQETIKKYYGG